MEIDSKEKEKEREKLNKQPWIDEMTPPVRNRLNIFIISMPARSRHWHWWRLILEKEKKKSKYSWYGRDSKKRDHVLCVLQIVF